MGRYLIVLSLVCFTQKSTLAQVFGGKTPFDNGGFNQQVGYKKGPVWGSLSQDFKPQGYGGPLKSGPITYGAGADFTSQKGHGIGGQVSHIPGVGGQGSVRGQVGLVSKPDHQLNAWAQHSRSLDNNFKPIGPATNSAGLNYQHSSGAGAFASGSKTNGMPAIGTVGGNIPLHKSKDGLTNLNLGGSTTFGHGMKPNHQVGVTFEKKF